ncbi:LAFA_0G08328g1_1 [Lachancea sp. 'fantastica']|nr:LAFA_0G08328g1_1 [Lachancea sp. 'fantastica']
MERRPQRRLRSTPPTNSSGDGLFDFDNDENGIAPDEELSIVSCATAGTKMLRQLANSDEVQRKKQELQKMRELVMEKRSLKKEENIDGSEKALSDPLSDDLYTAYHRKMQKQELRMVKQDEVQSEAEAERLRGVLESLESQYWLKTLLKTTKVCDSGDLEEISRKRRLTQDAINNMLDNFDEFKTRLAFLSRRGRLGSAKHLYARSGAASELPNARIDHYRRPPFGYGDIDLHSDGEEESMTNAQIKAHRKRLKEEKFGGTVIIQLRKDAVSSYSFAIIAEPLRSASIVECTRADKKEWSRKSETLPSRFESHEPFPPQTYTSKPIYSSDRKGCNSNGTFISPKKRTRNETSETELASPNATKQIRKTRKQKSNP